MTVGNGLFSGKGAREEGAAALTRSILSWRDDLSLQVRGAFRGFEILSRGKGATLLIGSDDERLPELFIRGAAIYKAQLNAENPVGTMQSIEYALRSLDKAVEDERERAARAEKMLADFQEQAGRPYEHEARLKELLIRQAATECALDLDKGERQVAAPAGDEENAEATRMPPQMSLPWLSRPAPESDQTAADLIVHVKAVSAIQAATKHGGRRARRSRLPGPKAYRDRQERGRISP